MSAPVIGALELRLGQGPAPRRIIDPLRIDLRDFLTGSGDE